MAKRLKFEPETQPAFPPNVDASGTAVALPPDLPLAGPLPVLPPGPAVDLLDGCQTEATVTVPIDPELPPTQFGIHIDTRLDVASSTKLRRIAAALDKARARLGNGQRVVGPSGALRYLLEQIP